ncbi:MULTISPECIES: PadR family transcriptional regulator [Sphingomonas]|uniref:PadR family transcriptional regulator n=1 Tax=Sphingomonas hankookensis TaxID=563996 RepID=A0ABR5Y939_9SPHN|nr:MULTISPECIES: PadR family transcriptional regulator [Sphingomonas]KZE08634.1 PadR family transcriptional regulator [Sphingomonas hankookensis]PZT96689.1 MAG: PadR family transcriptional regulator [Sphingomonas sp.]RSV30237.1 PadR family transcriptional regulator [Sphingomonas sp. ABOLH]WCP71227.1 PadR family transcriptional regulator [Sphingomonas hankookensis]
MRFGMGYASWTGGPGHGGRGGRHGGGPRGRVLGGDELKLVLLALIAEAPRHGYDLIRAVEARTGGAYAPSPGVVYPTLTLLTDMGLIEEQASEGTRKLFAVTEAGTTQLAQDAEQVGDLFARLTALGEHRARTDAGPIHRARANLRAALHHRLAGPEVDTDTLHAIAAILDEAAQKVERL